MDVQSTELLGPPVAASCGASNGAGPSPAGVARSDAAATRQLLPRPMVARDAPEETTMPSAMPVALQGLASLLEPLAARQPVDPSRRPGPDGRPVLPPLPTPSLDNSARSLDKSETSSRNLDRSEVSPRNLDDEDSFAGLDADPSLRGDRSPSSAPAGRERRKRTSEPSPLEKALEAASDTPPPPSTGTLFGLAADAAGTPPAAASELPGAVGSAPDDGPPAAGGSPAAAESRAPSDRPPLPGRRGDRVARPRRIAVDESPTATLRAGAAGDETDAATRATSATATSTTSARTPTKTTKTKTTARRTKMKSARTPSPAHTRTRTSTSPSSPSPRRRPDRTPPPTTTRPWRTNRAAASAPR
ncbi:MAG: hypothetical protein WKG00_07240 [Polyangiaceae bacterium]